MSDEKIASEIRRRDKEHNSLFQPNRAKVTSVIPNQESVLLQVEGSPGFPKAVIRHPYMGVNSHIRVMPDKGTALLTQMRGDRHQLEIWGYIANSLPAIIKDAITKNEFLYRLLQEGEIEIMSSGRAYTHYGQAGDMELRGGMVTVRLNQTELEYASVAPTFVRRLHDEGNSTFENHDRFGVVKRPDQKNPETRQTLIQDDQNNFAKERSWWLTDGEAKELTSSQEGHVVDITGAFVQQESTNKKMRYLRQFFNKKGLNLKVEIDEDLNVLLKNDARSKETTLDLGDKNVLDIKAKQLKETYQTSGNSTFRQSYTVTSPKVSVKSSDVKFGSVPVLSLTIAEKLVSGVLTPILTALSGALSILAADPALLQQPTKSTLTSLVSTVGVAIAQLPKISTQQIKITG